VCVCVSYISVGVLVSVLLFRSFTLYIYTERRTHMVNMICFKIFN